MDQIQHLASSNGSCPGGGTGRELTEGEAIQMIQTIEESLGQVSQAVTNSDQLAALAIACNASADYFTSGLREFVFRDQVSGTGA